MTVLAIIPARFGSKRLHMKNQKEIEYGITLVQQAINCAMGSGMVCEIIVLTDNPNFHFDCARHMTEPEELAGDHVDIATAVAYAVGEISEKYDHIMTLQPAVVARSPLIVRRMVQEIRNTGALGAVTAARTVPWQWTISEKKAINAWYPDRYPRSQDSKKHLCEINSVQITTRAIALDHKRWELPLIMAELPPWAASLDIDDEDDLRTACMMWPWAKPRLDLWDPPMHLIETINEKATA